MKAKYGVYACVLLVLGLAGVPRANCQIDQFQYFGSEIAMDGLSNLTIGGATSQLNAQAVSYRFTALSSGQIKAIQGYLITNPNVPNKQCDYACGTGGTLYAQIMADDGTQYHHPADPSKVQPLGTASLVNPVNAASFYTFTFSSPVSVTANTIYHLVWTNPTGTGKSGSGNFVSVDLAWTSTPQQTPTPAITQDQLSALELPPGGTWSTPSDWAELTPNGTSDNFLPIVNFIYSTPTNYTQGLGYYSIGSSYDVGGSDGSFVIREVITMPSNNVTVSGVNVRMAVSGSSELHAHLEDASGNTIDDCFIAASAFGSGSNYAGCSFSTSHALLANQTYHIDFEADAGTTYTAALIENGAKDQVGFGAGTTFPYGQAQYKSSGTGGSWTAVDANCNCWDFQFYFNVT
jgi:hypothetical protein